MKIESEEDFLWALRAFTDCFIILAIIILYPIIANKKLGSTEELFLYSAAVIFLFLSFMLFRRGTKEKKNKQTKSISSV